MAHLLIIDDDTSVLQLLEKTCRKLGHEVTAVETGKEALEALDASPPELMIVDLLIGDMNGLDIVRYGREHYPETQVIMVTGYGTVETAVEAMRLGAYDYLTKPFEIVDLQRTVTLSLQKSAAPPHPEPGGPGAADIALDSGELIGESEKIGEILGIVDKIADNDAPVLLEGEFGSGKQMVARSIHNASSRKEAPFKVLQCSALSDELLEEELFGSSAGRGESIFARAAGGTVLLEEIHVLPLRLQSKLDTHLEELAARRVVGDLPPAMDVRFIASSARPLQEAIDAGTFREDLYYELSVIPIEVPPLRSRPEDILPLSHHFLVRYAERTGAKVPEVDKYAKRLLEGYRWPGNVGELQNAIERACAFCEGGRIRPVDLPPKVAQKVEITDEDEKTTHHLPIGTPLSDYVRKQEKLFIQETLKYNEGSREKAASMLGVSIATLYRKMGLKLEKKKQLEKQ